MSSNYDRLSLFYDWLAASERPYRERLGGLLELQAGETVLDIGCGTAQGAPRLADANGGKAHVLGLDLSPGMLARARKNIGARGETAVSLLRAQALALPLAGGSCEAAILSFTLELFTLDHQKKLLAEIRRVLRPGGRLALLALSTHCRTAASEIYWSLHELAPSVFDCRPIAAAPLLSAAGFTLRRQEEESLWGLPLAILLAAAN